MSAEMTQVAPATNILAKASQLPPLPEEAILDHTQTVRRAIVQDLLKGGVPGDNSDRTLLVNMLDGLDRQAVNLKRIKADEKASSGLSEASALVVQLLKEAGRTKTSEVVDAVVREVPTLGADIPRPDLVPGELDISPRQMNYEEFAAGLPSVVSVLPDAEND